MKKITVLKCAATLKNRFYRVVFEHDGVRWTTDGWMSEKYANNLKTWIEEVKPGLKRLKVKISGQGHYISPRCGMDTTTETSRVGVR